MEPRWVSRAAQLVDELDAKEQGRTLSHRQPGSLISRLKTWREGKGNGKQKGKCSRKGNQQIAKGKGKDKGKGQPRP